MAQFQSHSLPQEKFLTISINLLHAAFVDASRTNAKKVFRNLSEGRPVHLTTVQMEDKSTVRFDLSMDHSEFRGKLNFGAFRASVAILVSNIAKALHEEEKIKVFNAEQDSGNILFAISAPTLEDGKANVMALGANLAGQQGTLMLRLMYLDPDQFRAESPVAGEAADQSGQA